MKKLGVGLLKAMVFSNAEKVSSPKFHVQSSRFKVQSFRHNSLKLLLLLFIIFAGSKVVKSQEIKISINKMPEAFFGNWYETDGSNGWAFGIEKDKFRVNDRFWDYKSIVKQNDVYKILISIKDESITYCFKNINNKTFECSEGKSLKYRFYKKENKISDIFNAGGEGQGIKFTEVSFDSIKLKASKEKKIIFIDVYADWCGPCKMMSMTTFTNDTVGSLYNDNFICYKYDIGNWGNLFCRAYSINSIPAYLFLDSRGDILHRSVGMMGVKDFVQLGQTALDSTKRLSFWTNEFDKGNRKPDFLKKYLDYRFRSNLETKEIADWYFAIVKGEELLNNENIKVIYYYQNDLNSESFNYFVENRLKFGKICTDTLYSFDGNNNKKMKTGQKYVDHVIAWKYSIGLNIAANQEDWKTYNMLYMKFKNSDLGIKDSVLAEEDINKLRVQKDWKSYVEAVKNYVAKYCMKDGSLMNNYAWGFYVNNNITDKHALKDALGWAKNSIEISSKYYNNDTYAALLYKTGDLKNAIIYAEKAIELAKKEGINYKETEELLKRMK